MHCWEMTNGENEDRKTEKEREEREKGENAETAEGRKMVKERRTVVLSARQPCCPCTHTKTDD